MYLLRGGLLLFKIDQALTLTLVEPSFAKTYYEIVQAERDYLSQWLVWPPYADSENFFISFVNKSLRDYADGKSLVCAMIYHGQLIGNVSFNTICHELKKVNIGYWLSANYQGKGIVTRSVAKLISHAFNQLGMEKIEISAATENFASRNVCQRLGFTLEGTISNSEHLNGRIISHAIYGLKKEQWLELS